MIDNFIDGILILSHRASVYFFDPDSLIVFSKLNQGTSDEDIICRFNEDKKELKGTGRVLSKECNSVKLELHLTDKCNLRCKYCYLEEFRPKESCSCMSDEILERALLFVQLTFPKLEVLYLTLYGGEPLLFWRKFDFILKILNENFKSTKVKIGLATNGTIINDDILRFLKENNVSFQLSWDGDKQQQDKLRPTVKGKGSYELIDKNLSSFKTSREGLSVRATITPYNMDLVGLFYFFVKKGFKQISFSSCIADQEEFRIGDIEKFMQEWDKLAEAYLKHIVEGGPVVRLTKFYDIFKMIHLGRKERFSCGCGKNLFIVSQDGSFYACHRFVGNEKYKIGNLDFGFFNNDLRDYLLNFNVDDEKNCSSCFARYVCGGGCLYEKTFFPDTCRLFRHILCLGICLYGELSTKYPLAFEKLVEQFEV